MISRKAQRVGSSDAHGLPSYIRQCWAEASMMVRAVTWKHRRKTMTRCLPDHGEVGTIEPNPELPNARSQEVAANTIELELKGEKIAVTFRPQDGARRTHEISLASALELSCVLLRCSQHSFAMSLSVPGMALKVDNSRRPQAWLTMVRAGQPDITAHIMGTVVREIGKRLHDHWLRAKGITDEGPERSIYVRPVSRYALEA